MRTYKTMLLRIATGCLSLTVLILDPGRLRGEGFQETAGAQQKAETPSPDLAGIAHVALRVRDLAASTAFYEKLGFVRAFALSRDGAVYEAFIKINDRQFIELYPVTEKDAQVGFLHVCFEASHIQVVHDFYISQGLVPIEVRKAGAGNLLFTMPGPATLSGAQNIEYTQYMPGSLHTRDIGQHLGNDRIADEVASVTIGVSDPAAAHAFYADKLRFAPAPRAGKRLHIPGATGESVEIGFSEAHRLKTQFTLRTSVKDPAESLTQHGVPFRKVKGIPAFFDPDGNGILLESR